MPNISRQNTQKPTSSGHGALGMGGQPSDDPRDLESGGWDPETNDDRSNPVSGASGNRRGDVSGGNVAGVQGDRAVTGPIDEAVKKAR